MGTVKCNQEIANKHMRSIEANYCVELNSLSLTTCPMRLWAAASIVVRVL